MLVGSLSTYDDGGAIANNFAARVARAGYTPLPFARATDANSPFQANMNTWGVSGEVDYDLGGATLTSIAVLRNWNWFPLNDGDHTALSVNLQGNINNFQRQFSQELRPASAGDCSTSPMIPAKPAISRTPPEARRCAGGGVG